MKRILSLVLITIMAILPSCGSKDIASTPETKNETTIQTENKTITNLQNNNGGNNMKPVVYFTKDITADSLVKIYEKLGWTPTGKVGVKISTGEPPKSNYLKADLIGELVKKVN